MVSLYRVGITIDNITNYKSFFTFLRIFGLKLWYPQVLQSVNDNEVVTGDDGIGFCDIIERLSNINKSSTDSKCTVVSNFNIANNSIQHQ